MAAAREETIAVRGLSPLVRDFRKLSKGGLQAPLVAELRALGEPVASGVRLREGADRFGDRTISGVKVIVRQRGVNVEQTRRKSTDLRRRRKNFGKLQMEKAFIPSLEENKGQIMVGVEALLDRLLVPSGSVYEETNVTSSGATTTRVTGGLL